MEYNFWWDVGYDAYKNIQPRLEENIGCNYLIVGGGLSGLHAALELTKQGVKKVVLVEGFECGRGTTGASTGFVMPDAEESYTGLRNRFGVNEGKWLWNYVQEGCDLVWNTAQKYNLKTDIEQQDTLYIGLPKHEHDIIEEHAQLKSISYPTKLLPTTKTVREQLNTVAAQNAIVYSNTYAMNPLLYAHHLKEYLLSMGVTIYEHTTITSVNNNQAITKEGSTILFEHAIITTNKLTSKTNLLANKISGVQSSACVSRILTPEEVLELFPDGKKKMVYDSRDFYLYWRLTSDNRIILGQDSILTLLSPKASLNPIPMKNAIKELRQLLPITETIEFEHYWSEIIDGTFDLIPLIYKEGAITYSGGNVGLPWAARTGQETALVALGKQPIHPLLSIKRVPFSMFGTNQYIKQVQYAIAYQLSTLIRKK